MTAKANGRPDAGTSEPASNAEQRSGKYSVVAEKASGAKAKLDWLDTMSVDPAVKPIAFQVCYILVSRYRNATTGRCDPALETIAKLLQVEEKTVRRAIENAVATGYLRSQRRGKGHSNQYWPSFDDRTKKSDHEDAMIGHFCTDDRTFQDRMIGQKCPGNPGIEPGTEPGASAGPAIAGPRSAQDRGSSSVPASKVAARKAAPRYKVGQWINTIRFGECEVKRYEDGGLIVRLQSTSHEQRFGLRDDGFIIDEGDDDDIPW